MYIAIEGVIGVGKTTLARLLKKSFEADLLVEVFEENPFLIADYTFAKDMLFARINISGDELDMYYRVHEALAEKIPLPDLIVYLRADTDVLMQSIAMRDRPYERDMERAYIAGLNEAYEDFFDDYYRGVPVLPIDTDQINIVSDEGHRAQVEAQIRAALASAPRQSELPL